MPHFCMGRAGWRGVGGTVRGKHNQDIVYEKKFIFNKGKIKKNWHLAIQAIINDMKILKQKRWKFLKKQVRIIVWEGRDRAEQRKLKMDV